MKKLKLKIFLETMGCQMNKLDSELVIGRLRAAGHEIVAQAADAQVVLYNTCSVRDHAEQKVLSRLGEQCKRKRLQEKDLIVGVLGCMAQRLGEALGRKMPGVDLICGPSQLDQLAEMIDRVVCDRRRIVSVAPPRRAGERTDAVRMEHFDAGRPVDTRQRRAYVRVQRGCNNFCTYCIVPYVRGAEYSRDPKKIVEEVRRLADAGCREVTLLGQTVSRYRHVADGHTTTLADLLARLDGIGGLERIKFVTSYPGGFDRAILQAMRDLPTVCEQLHVPAQSGSDRMLQAMHRRYTVAEYLDLVDAARDTVPGITLAGDFIVGFPGETEQDFQGSCELVRRVKYRNGFIFKYSPRPGTTATGLVDDVPDPVKRRRNNELLALQNAQSLAHNQALIGSVQVVGVEGPSGRADKQPTPAPPGQIQLIGRTRGDHIVAFDGESALTGEYVHVRIASATALALTGERVKG